MSFFPTQEKYVRWHSPEAYEARRRDAERQREEMVGKALSLFNDGDIEGARQVLFDGGISFDGICEYFQMWRA